MTTVDQSEAEVLAVDDLVMVNPGGGVAKHATSMERVTLKSGGPTMRVAKIVGDDVTCTLSGSSGAKPVSRTFQRSQLSRVSTRPCF